MSKMYEENVGIKPLKARHDITKLDLTFHFSLLHGY